MASDRRILLVEDDVLIGMMLADMFDALDLPEPAQATTNEEALALIRRVAPREAYLTHMSHDIGLQAETEPRLPCGVHMAYDGLQVEIGEE